MESAPQILRLPHSTSPRENPLVEELQRKETELQEVKTLDPLRTLKIVIEGGLLVVWFFLVLLLLVLPVVLVVGQHRAGEYLLLWFPGFLVTFGLFGYLKKP